MFDGKCGGCIYSSDYFYKENYAWCLNEHSKNFGKPLARTRIGCKEYAPKKHS